MGMMWTTENRPRYNRDKLRYPSDLTDEEWAHVEHLIPPAKRGGRRRGVDEREVLTAVTKGRNSARHWPSCCLSWPLKSSNVRIPQRASRFCPDAGWSSAPSPGSTGAVAWPKI